MAYKSLLTFANTGEPVSTVIDSAARLARAHDARLDALALGVDRTQVGYAYMGSGGFLLQVAMERAESEARANEALVKSALEAQGTDLRWSLDSVVTQIGALPELVAARARYADLVIQGRPYGKALGPESEVVVEAAMFEGMAPVLVVPESGLAEATPKRIVVAWNQGREALVSVRRALPLLKAADKVVVSVIDPPTHGPERSDPGGSLCQLLVRHGVRAEVSVIARTLPRISDVLARQCQDVDADLLVMGAYGHSRFRQAILGGTTRNILENTQLPVFMAH